MHARFAPSSLARTVQCPGWISIYESVRPPEDTTEAIVEGEAAHWLALEHSEGRPHGVGVRAPNGWEITSEMVLGARLWTQTVGGLGIPEMPVTIDRIHED